MLTMVKRAKNHIPFGLQEKNQTPKWQFYIVQYYWADGKFTRACNRAMRAETIPDP